MSIYFAVVHKDRGSAYGIRFPDVPGCFSAADKPHEIIAKAKEALALWQEGDPLPEPGSIEDVAESAKDDLAAGAFIVAVPFKPRPAGPTVEMRKKTIRQRRGPAIRFTGALIAKTEFDTRNGYPMRLEVYQTEGGAYVSASISDVETRAHVIEPGEEAAMRCAVLESLEWAEWARSMLRDQLGWKFVREVA